MVSSNNRSSFSSKTLHSLELLRFFLCVTGLKVLYFTVGELKYAQSECICVRLGNISKEPVLSHGKTGSKLRNVTIASRQSMGLAYMTTVVKGYS